MDLRGPIVDPGEVKTVDTSNGQADLAAVSLLPNGGNADPVSVTLWGKWTENAECLETGMELLVTDVDQREFRGETEYATTRESFVVVEPGFLVDVTDIRAWVQCPRMYYLNKLSGVPLVYPVVKGTIIHEVFGDLLRGRDLDDAVADRVADAGLDLGLLDRDAEAVRKEVRANAQAIDGWLAQDTLSTEDKWRSEQTLISPTFGIKGRADAVRRGMPVEIKTGKNLKREPRFHDKVQAACYALLLGERADGDGSGGVAAGHPNTGTLLYTKNTALDRTEASGDLSPAKEFSIGKGFLEYVLRQRNELAAMECDRSVPTGHEADAICEYCFEQDTCMAVAGRLDQESKAGQVGRPVPEEERDYFDRMYCAIEAERRAVHREYRKLWEQTAEERATADRALVDLEPAGRCEREGGHWELRARKRTNAVSKIREGDVVLASNGDPVSGRAELARVKQLGKTIVVTADEPLEVRRLDVYPSELSVDRQLTALHDAILKGDPDRKDVLFGRRQPEFARDEVRSAAPRSSGEYSEPHGEKREYIPNNDAQNEAVNLAVNAGDFALVHGPPGTGKTYTLAHIVRALVEQGERVLLSAFTNRAVDNALEALREQGFEEFVRVGTETGVRGDMQDARLQVRGNPGERASELREAPVVAATTAACGARALRAQSFDAAVVDEAGQLTEPGTFLATNLADRFVLVGDHQQLPPVVQSGEEILERSLFERLSNEYPGMSVLLDRQYRMAQRIQYFASREFYDGQLRPASAEVAARRIGDLSGVSPDALPAHLRDRVSFLDPDGRAEGHTNPVEAEAVAEVAEAFRRAGVSADDIGVIAPFRAQVSEIARRLPEVTVDTVDRFQGSSKEVIILSFVATGDLEGPIFEDRRRINVALTRAKRALVLVGDTATLESDPFYARLLAWAQS